MEHNELKVRDILTPDELRNIQKLKMNLINAPSIREAKKSSVKLS